MKKLIIIGAGGHGKVIADIAKKNGYEDIAFLDDNPAMKECGGYPVIGNSEKISQIDAEYIVGIGNAIIRQCVRDRITSENRPLATLVHPNAVVGENVTIGCGSVVMAGAVINPGAQIGTGCIINTCASVDHDCILGDYVHIAVGAHLAGTVQVGERAWVGAGATVSNNLKLAADCIIGAGAVVVKDIEEAGTYVGVPAKKLK